MLGFAGTLAWHLDPHAPGLSFGYMYAEDHVKYGTERNAFIFVAVNAYWEAQRYLLPELPAGYRWKPAFDGSGSLADDSGRLYLGPRASAVLAAEAD